MSKTMLRKFLLWYPDPKNAPGVCAVIDFPKKQDTIFKHLRPNDYVDLTEKEARIAGGDLYFSGRYELKLTVETGNK